MAFDKEPPAITIDKAFPLLESSNQELIIRGIPKADIIAAPTCIKTAIRQNCQGAVATENAANPPQPNNAPAIYIGLRPNFLNNPPTIGEANADAKVPIEKINEKLAIENPIDLSCIT